MSATGHRTVRVVVSVFGYHGNLLEIFSGRRRRRGPFQSFRAPRIRTCRRSVSHGPGQIDERNKVADAEDGSAGGRHHVENLNRGGVHSITTGHAEISEHELREESQVEAHENYQRGKTRPAIGIETAGDFGPPEMNASQVSHHRAADHNVMEMSHNKIGAVQVHVSGERSEKKSSEAAHGEQADKAQRIEHGSVVGY